MQSTGQTLPITTLQLIVSAITLTTGAFFVAALFLGPTSPPAEGQTRMTLILLATAASMFSAGLVATRALDKKLMATIASRREVALEEVRGGQAPGVLSTLTIVHAATGEGIALIGIVAYLLEAQSLAFIPVGLGLAWVAAVFPTRERLLARVTESRI